MEFPLSTHNMEYRIMASLLNYLNLLDQDANARDAHEFDSLIAMSNFGLSHQEQLAMLSGDKAQVTQLLGMDPRDEWTSVEVTFFANNNDLQCGHPVNLLVTNLAKSGNSNHMSA